MPAFSAVHRQAAVRAAPSLKAIELPVHAKQVYCTYMVCAPRARIIMSHQGHPYMEGTPVGFRGPWAYSPCAHPAPQSMQESIRASTTRIKSSNLAAGNPSSDISAANCSRQGPVVGGSPRAALYEYLTTGSGGKGGRVRGRGRTSFLGQRWRVQIPR